MRSRIFLIEDYAPMREGITRLLEAEFDLVGYAVDGRVGLQAAMEHNPNVIVLDVSLPGMSGMRLLPLLRGAVPRAAVVMCTNHTGAEYVEEAYRRGAHGYVFKHEVHEMLLPAVRRACLSRAVQAC